MTDDALKQQTDRELRDRLFYVNKAIQDLKSEKKTFDDELMNRMNEKGILDD